MAEVNVHVVHFARVDTLAGFWIRLIGKAQMDASRHGERSIQLRAGGSPGKDTDLKLLPAEVRVRDAACQLNRNCLGITRPGEATHADLVAGLNESRSCVGAHDPLRQTGIQNPRRGWGNDSSHARSPSIESELFALTIPAPLSPVYELGPGGRIIFGRWAQSGRTLVVSQVPRI